MKFAFIAKHRGDLAGGMAMRSAGRLAIRLPRLAHSVPQHASPDRRGSHTEDQGELHVERPHLWRSTGLARRPGGRVRMWLAQDRAADALGSPAGAASASWSARRTPERAVATIAPNVLDRQFTGRAAEPEVDRRLHLHLDGRGLALRCCRDRSVLTSYVMSAGR